MLTDLMTLSAVLLAASLLTWHLLNSAAYRHMERAGSAWQYGILVSVHTGPSHVSQRVSRHLTALGVRSTTGPIEGNDSTELGQHHVLVFPQDYESAREALDRVW